MVIEDCWQTPKKEPSALDRELIAFDGFDILFCLMAGRHDLMAAAKTLQAEICAGAQHQPLLLPTGMGLLHNEHIA